MHYKAGEHRDGEQGEQGEQAKQGVKRIHSGSKFTLDPRSDAPTDWDCRYSSLTLGMFFVPTKNHLGAVQQGRPAKNAALNKTIE